MTAVIIAIGYILYLYPLSFLLGEGAFFNEGDACQHVSGWLSYCADNWHYPLLHTSLINYPEGVNIAFTDSIPLAAIFFKMIRAFLPEHFHYIGLWHAFAYLSQGIAAVILVRAAGFKSYLASVAAILFALSSPVLLCRLGHTSLMTQSLILLSLANYFCFIKETRSFQWVTNAQIAILFCSFLIHPYFFAMNFVFMLSLFIVSYQRNKNIFPIFKKALLLILLMGITFFIFGYKGQNVQTDGFHFYSLNLLTLFSFHDATGGQYEGYNYLGMGIIGLLFLSVFLNRKILWQQLKRHHVLIIFLICLSLYALSNNIYFHNTLLLQYEVPSFLKPITNTFRASGRFFWVPFYFITFISLFGVLKLSNKALCMLILAVACIVQAFDLKTLRANVIAQTHKASNSNIQNWKNVVKAIDGFIIFPVVGYGSFNVLDLLQYQRIASRFSKFTNTSYIARGASNYENKLKFIKESQPEKCLYLLEIKEMEKSYFLLPSMISNFIVNETCPIQGDFILCLKGKNREWWIDQIGPCEFYLPKIRSPNTISFNAIDLPTQIGFKENTFLRSEVGKSGFLNYGPYMKLSKGNYKATINFLNSNNSEEDLGFWDICTDCGKKQLIANNITNTDSGTIETIFEVTPELENSKFEIRTFSNGKGQLTLKSIMLERL